MTRTCPQCERSFEPNAKHQIYDVDACRQQGWVEKEVLSAQTSVQRVGEHPLAEARAEQEATAVNRRYGLLIRQAIIDRLKTTGTCHADDLEPLYPADELARKRCRKLAGAQFGSLASPRGNKEPLIREKERRKSSIPERKCAKSGVFEFTKAGWDRYGSAGVGGGNESGRPSRSESSGHSPHSGEAGLTGPGSGAGEVPRVPGSVVEPPATSTAPPDILPGGRGQARKSMGEPVNAASGEPLSLLPEPDPESWAA